MYMLYNGFVNLYVTVGWYIHICISEVAAAEEGKEVAGRNH